MVEMKPLKPDRNLLQMRNCDNISSNLLRYLSISKKRFLRKILSFLLLNRHIMKKIKKAISCILQREERSLPRATPVSVKS